MLLLTATTDTIELLRSSTADVDYIVSYMDHTLSTDNVEGGRLVGTFNTAAQSAIVTAPGSGVVRNVKEVTVSNRHASASNTVTIIFDANGTEYRVFKITLLAGETLQYVEGRGWTVYEAVGGPIRVTALAANQSNSTTTLTEVTGMSLTTGIGTFIFEYFIIYQSTATGTGVRFSVNHSGTVSQLVATIRNSTADTTATSAQTGIADQDAVASTTHLYQVMAARAKSSTGWGTTAGVDTANADMMAVIEGITTVTADGDIELWHASETAVQTTVKAGSSLRLTRTD